jgi:hypothetical protein
MIQERCLIDDARLRRGRYQEYPPSGAVQKTTFSDDR